MREKSKKEKQRKMGGSKRKGNRKSAVRNRGSKQKVVDTLGRQDAEEEMEEEQVENEMPVLSSISIQMKTNSEDLNQQATKGMK
jgi:hypothetical protein